ncbi:5-hydroxytryptamine receptor 5A [Biomphalaria pfeifferi]|uniref:5-hydroxytryptamine receptor 5A n=1 Tax=Biomphalaria pfeifferi TaxID=112525 RepID=A0AAD8F8S2_BIOPF|nr:5-hydroxytryptamine receptor 5A [Biomphalaria pfeifferi]
MFNQSACVNVSVDLSDSSTRFSSHPLVLTISATALCLLAAFIVGSNIVVIVLVIYDRHHRKYVNRTVNHGGFSNIKKLLFISVSAVHMIVGAFCIPLAIVQVIANGKWTLGSTFCTGRMLVEVLTELIRIYHSLCFGLDSYAMVRKPFKYKMLTSRSGYVTVLFSWTVPMAIVCIAVGLGWHRDGVEDALSCLEESRMCVALLGKKFSLIVLPSGVCLSFGVFVAMATVTLKEIQRIHQRRINHIPTYNSTSDVQKPGKAVSAAKTDTKQIKRTSFTSACSVQNKTQTCTIKSRRKLSCLGFTATTRKKISSQFCLKYPNQIKEFHGRDEQGKTNQDGRHEQFVSTVSQNSLAVVPSENKAIKTNEHLNITSLSVEVKNFRKRKVLCIIITMVTIHFLYLSTSLVVNAFFVFKTRLFPLWLFSLLTCFRYLHVAMAPVFFLQHRYFKNQWNSMMNVKPNS